MQEGCSHFWASHSPESGLSLILKFSYISIYLLQKQNINLKTDLEVGCAAPWRSVFYFRMTLLRKCIRWWLQHTQKRRYKQVWSTSYQIPLLAYVLGFICYGKILGKGLCQEVLVFRFGREGAVKTERYFPQSSLVMSESLHNSPSFIHFGNAGVL